MKRKLFIFFSSALLLYQSSALPIFATSVAPIPTGKWYSPSLGQFREKVFTSPDQEIFGERYTYAQVNWIINSISLIFQFDITSPQARQAIQDLFNSYKTGDSPTLANFSALGPSGLTLGLISEIYQHPPASGIQYLAKGFEKFNIATPVYAQGYGYNNNSIVLPLWTASRNLCYFLMVVLLIAAGFMIMFRIKVNAQTAVSIQVMIPKIIITLILITFSYAIAGLVVDLIYLVLTLILSALSLTGSPPIITNLSQTVSFFTGSYGAIVLHYMIGMAILLIVGVLAALLSPIGGAGVLIALIVSIVILWLLLRVWWMLLTTYISILIGFITAPWYIILGLIPGNKTGFGTWLRSMVANASVFVVVPLMFLLSIYIGGNFLSGPNAPQWLADAINSLSATGIGSPPLPIGSNAQAISLPLFGTGTALSFTLGFFASLAILALIPKTAKMIRDALKVSDFKYGTAFGEALTDPYKRYGQAKTQIQDPASAYNQGLSTLSTANDYTRQVRTSLTPTLPRSSAGGPSGGSSPGSPT